MHQCGVCVKQGRGGASYASEAELAAHRVEAHGEAPPDPAPAPATEATGTGSGFGPVIRKRDPLPSPPAGPDFDDFLDRLESLEAEHESSMSSIGKAIQRLADDLEVKGSQWASEGQHFTSEIASVRSSIVRLGETLEAFVARLKAQEDQALGARIRRLEEQTGLAPDSGVSDLERAQPGPAADPTSPTRPTAEPVPDPTTTVPPSDDDEPAPAPPGSGAPSTPTDDD